MANPWVKNWEIKGTSGKVYKVSQRQSGDYGCSCPAWMFSKVKPRPDCQHILRVRLAEGAPKQPQVSKITNLGDGSVVRSITFSEDE